MPATVFVKWDYGLAQMETTSSGSTHLVPVADKVLVFSAGNRACRGTTILHKTTNAILEMALHKIIDYVTLVCSALLVRYISANIANFFASNGPSGAPPPPGPFGCPAGCARRLERVLRCTQRAYYLFYSLLHKIMNAIDDVALDDRQ